MARVYRAKVEIDAPAEQVWAILSDLDRYADWNPFTPKIETTRVVGEPVVLHVSFDAAPPIRQVEILRRWAPGEELRWGMTIGPAWLFRAERTQRVEVLSEARCRYVTEDAFAGLLSPLIELLYGGRVQRGLEAVAAALARTAAPPGAASS